MIKLLNWVKSNKDEKLFPILFSIFFFILIITSIIFFSVCFYFKISKEIITASYTNLLVFNATLFAPLAAYFFINDWKKQTNMNLVSLEARKIWGTLQKVEKSSYAIDDLIRNNPISKYSDNNNFSIFMKEIDDTVFEIQGFSELTNLIKTDLGDLSDKYSENRDTYYYLIVADSFNEETDETARKNLITTNEKIRNILKEYIIIQ